MIGSKQPGAVEAMFDRIAPVYNRLNRIMTGALDLHWRKRLVAAVRPSAKRRLRVLDACAGTGDVAAMLAKRPWVSRVTAVDISARMMKVARRRLGSAPVDLLLADVTLMPVPDAGFDAATMAFGLRNIADRRQALAEITRVLRPGGRLAILEFAPPDQSSLPGMLYSAYLRALPLIGGTISGSAVAYSYLSESINAFPAPERIAAEMRGAGLRKVQITAIFWNAVFLYTASAPRGMKQP